MRIFRSIPDLLILITGLAVLSFAFYQASSASFTHDESYTYLHYPQASFMDILSHASPFTNNHLLNTMGMKYSEDIFGTSEWSLRLPNLLALALYMIYSFLLFKNRERWFALWAFLLLISNAFLIDLFSMARGYGLSIAFMMMGAYHLARAIQPNALKMHQSLFHIAAILAVLSNFTMLLFYAAGIAILFMVLINKRTRPGNGSFWKVGKPSLIMIGVAALILYEPVRRVIKFNAFDFGGKGTFISSTVDSVIRNGLHGFYIEPSIIVLRLVLFILLGSAIVWMISKMIRTKNEVLSKEPILVVFTTLSVLIPLITIIQHQVLGSDLLVDRFAFFLWPLALVAILSFIASITKSTQAWLPNVVVMFAAIIMIWNFSRTEDPKTLAEWSYDSNTKEAVLWIAEKAKTINERDLSLGCTWLYEPTLNFYRNTRKLDRIQPVNKALDLEKNDYLFDSKAQADTLDLSAFRVLKTYTPNQCIVLARIE